MKNKGFSLVEILAVIVIMAVVFGIATANSLRIIDKAAKEEYKALAKILEISAKIYVLNIEPVELNEVGGNFCVTLENLNAEGYIDLPLKDPRNDTDFPTTTCVMVTKINDNKYDIEFEKES